MTHVRQWVLDDTSDFGMPPLWPSPLSINLIEGGEEWFFLALLSFNLLSICIGNAYSWTSPAIPVLYESTTNNPLSRPITTLEESWITSLLSLGAACGPLVAGTSAAKYGRKRTLMIFSTTFLISYAIIAFATRVEYFFIARFILGLGVGSVFTILPMYVGEISEDANRGFLSCLIGVMLTFGLLLCYSIGPYTSLNFLSLFCLAPCILFIIFFEGFCPESPYYLVSINDNGSAEESLLKLRKKSIHSIQKELMDIIKSVEESKSNKGGFRELFRSKSAIKGLIICVGAMFFQQFSGITAVLANMQSIFNATGSSISGDISTIIVGCIQFFMNIVASQLVDRLGRRILLMTSIAGCFISLVVLGVFFYLRNNSYNTDALFWLPIACLIFYIVTYNFGLGVLPWAIAGEVFPPNLKSLCSTITACSCLIEAFLLTMFFPTLSQVLGLDLIFWLFSICCALGLVFFYFVVIETKGKSFEDIQKILGS